MFKPSLLLRLNKQSTNVTYRTLKVIGIETSCDDTGVAIVDTNRIIHAESLRNQWHIHKNAGHAKVSTPNHKGGIIPNLAKIMHFDNLLYCVSECIEKNDGWNSIDAIATTVKPGMETCLWQGINFTKQLLDKYKKPFIPIHHMEAHALTPRLFDSSLEFPYLTVLISGGNSLIGLVVDAETFIRFGETIDQPLGNCIDRSARALGLYQRHKDDSLSGGAIIEKYAEQGDPSLFKCLYDKMKRFCEVNRDCNFSFSGLGTAVLKVINENERELKNESNEQIIRDLCASIQNAALVQLKNRIERAILYYRIHMNHKSDLRSLVISGGVASNRFIFNKIKDMCKEYGINVVTPPIEYCTDNGVMIAWNGCEKLLCHTDSIINVVQQTPEYFEKLRPSSNCELGYSISKLIKQHNIRVKV